MSKILYLEDQLAWGKDVEGRLVRKGFDVHRVRSGTEAVDWLAGTTSCTAVLLDCRLGEPDVIQREPRGDFIGDEAGLHVLAALRAAGFRRHAFLLTQIATEIVSKVRVDPWRSALGAVTVIPKQDMGSDRATEILFRYLYANEQRAREQHLEGYLLDQLPDIRPILQRVREEAARGLNHMLFYGETAVGKEILVDYYVRHCFRNAPLVRIACDGLHGEDKHVVIRGIEQDYPSSGQPLREGAFERAGRGIVYLNDLGKVEHENEKLPLYTMFPDFYGDRPGTFTRVGGNRQVSSHCIVLATANIDEMDDRHLPARLRGRQRYPGRKIDDALMRRFLVQLEIPPLRERPNDIAVAAPFLVRRAWQKIAGWGDPEEVTAAEIRALQGHPLPRNWTDLEEWATTRRLPPRATDDRGGGRPPAPPQPLTPTTSPEERLRRNPYQYQIALDEHTGIADYLREFGKRGLAKRAYWQWLVDSGLSFEEINRVSGYGRPAAVAKALHDFRLTCPGLPPESAHLADKRQADDE